MPGVGSLGGPPNDPAGTTNAAPFPPIPAKRFTHVSMVTTPTEQVCVTHVIPSILYVLPPRTNPSAETVAPGVAPAAGALCSSITHSPVPRQLVSTVSFPVRPF